MEWIRIHRRNDHSHKGNAAHLTVFFLHTKIPSNILPHCLPSPSGIAVAPLPWHRRLWRWGQTKRAWGSEGQNMAFSPGMNKWMILLRRIKGEYEEERSGLYDKLKGNGWRNLEEIGARKSFSAATNKHWTGFVQLIAHWFYSSCLLVLSMKKLDPRINRRTTQQQHSGSFCSDKPNPKEEWMKNGRNNQLQLSNQTPNPQAA